MRLLTFVLLPGFALAAPSLARAEDSLRCDGGIVSIGDSKLDLLGKCGAPALRDSHRDERVEARATPSGEGQERHVDSRRVVRTVERWTYDHGRNRFSDTVTLVLGKVTAVERGGRGYAEPGQKPRATLPRARCEPSTVRVGDTALDVLSRCGEPALREAQDEVFSWSSEGVVEAVGAAQTLVIEVWTYDFGPSSLVRHLRLEDGKVSRVDTGGRGYSE